MRKTPLIGDKPIVTMNSGDDIVNRMYKGASEVYRRLNPWVEKEKAVLPEGFLFNLNARDYDESTGYITAASGSQFDSVRIINYADFAPATLNSTHKYIENNFSYSEPLAYSSAEYPYNLTSTGDTDAGSYLTVVIRAMSYDNGDTIIANRDDNTHNWMVRFDGNCAYLHTARGGGDVAEVYDVTKGSIGVGDSVSADIVVMESRPGEYGAGWVDTRVRNITKGTSSEWITSECGEPSTAIGLFKGFASADNLNEMWDGRFHWASLYRRLLTDEEIQQVIDFNEQ